MNDYTDIIKKLSDSESFAEGLIELNNTLTVDRENYDNIVKERDELKTSLANTKLELSKVLISNSDGSVGSEDDEIDEDTKKEQWADEVLGLS